MLYSAHELSDVYSFCLRLFFQVALTSGYLKLLVISPQQGQYVGASSVQKFVCLCNMISTTVYQCSYRTGRNQCVTLLVVEYFQGLAPVLTH